MAAKRKGGLKLNAICAKLSRQVEVEKGGEAGAHTEGSPLRPRDKERSGPESGVEAFTFSFKGLCPVARSHTRYHVCAEEAPSSSSHEVAGELRRG